eukprot:Colp12_sorted_trinity150504_noHs@30680
MAEEARSRSSRFDSEPTPSKRPAESGTEDGTSERKRKKKSRWGAEDDKALLLPLMVPAALTKEQEESILIHLRLEEISKRLRLPDLGIPVDPRERSPSPPPTYDRMGKRTNTREMRTRKKLMDEQRDLVDRAQKLNPNFRPPVDYKPEPRRLQEKILIPQADHPEINFIGLLIGPRGNTLKSMEKDTGAKIMIRGKGSMKEGKGRRDGLPVEGEDEELHALITAQDEESLAKAVARVENVIKMGQQCPEGQNELKRKQLRELAIINGTLRDDENLKCKNCASLEHSTWDCPERKNVTNNIICSICGGAGHIARDCMSRSGDRPPEPANAQMDDEYLSLMKELGEAPEKPSSSSAPWAQKSEGNPWDANKTSTSTPSQEGDQPPWAKKPSVNPAPGAAPPAGVPPVPFGFPPGMPMGLPPGMPPMPPMPGMPPMGFPPGPMPWGAPGFPPMPPMGAPWPPYGFPPPFPGAEYGGGDYSQGYSQAEAVPADAYNQPPPPQ